MEARLNDFMDRAFREGAATIQGDEDEYVDPVPPYLSPGEIARACSFSKKRVMTFLAPKGPFVNPSTILLFKHGNRFWVSADQLRNRWPEMYERVADWYALRKRR